MAKILKREFIPIHDEPECHVGPPECSYNEPHYHGLACDKTCPECWGYCHPICPAYHPNEVNG